MREQEPASPPERLSWDGVYIFGAFRFQPVTRRLFADHQETKRLGNAAATLLEILLAECPRSGDVAGIRFADLAAELDRDDDKTVARVGRLSKSRVASIRNLMDRIKAALGGGQVRFGDRQVNDVLTSWNNNGDYRMRFLPCSAIAKEPRGNPDVSFGEAVSADTAGRLARMGWLSQESVEAAQAAGNEAIIMGDERDTPGALTSVLIFVAEREPEIDVPKNDGNGALALRAEFVSEAEIASILGVSQDKVRGLIRDAIAASSPW